MGTAGWLRRATQAAAWTAGLFSLGLAGMWWAGWWDPWARPVPATMASQLPLAAPPTERRIATPPASTPRPAPLTLASSTPSQSAPPPASSDVLGALNRVRRSAGVAPVKVQGAWRPGCAAHAKYLVREDRAEHRQDPASPYRSAAGEACAPGHYFVSSQGTSGATRAVTYWAAGAFHLPQLLDPRLTHVAYGEAHDGAGTLRSAAVLDVRRGLKGAGRYPVRYPAPGTVAAAGPAATAEWPDPSAGCAPAQPGPSGAPIALLLGPDRANRVKSARLRVGDRVVPACLLTPTTFQGASPGETQAGRNILATQGAALLLPDRPLAAGARVQVEFVTARGPVRWAFRVAAAARQ